MKSNLKFLYEDETGSRYTITELQKLLGLEASTIRYNIKNKGKLLGKKYKMITIKE